MEIRHPVGTRCHGVVLHPAHSLRRRNMHGSQNDESAGFLPRVEWDEIRAPGCYLHLATGLLARVYAEDLANRSPGIASGGGRCVRLSENPGATMAQLREVAAKHGLEVNA